MSKKPSTNLDPNQRRQVDAAFAQALALHQQGQLTQAEQIYKEILALDSQHADSYHMLGGMAQQLGQTEVACDLIRQAIKIDGKNPHYHYNLGVSLQNLEQLSEATKAYQKAIRLKPDHLQAYENLSVVFCDAGNLQGAVEACKKALAINSRSLVANQNMATLEYRGERRQAALKYANKALQVNPVDASSHWLKALALLAQGDYEQGWREYEWRFHADEFAKHNPTRVVPFPKWDGSSLADRKILLHAEQGIGDEVLFASCFTEIVAQADTCFIECDPRLQPIYARSFPDAVILPSDMSRDFSWNAGMPEFDWRLSCGSLPKFLRRSSADFPHQTQYLFANPELVSLWRDALNKLDHEFNVGISWRGGADKLHQAVRSIPLDLWHGLFDRGDTNLVNLQYGDHSQEIAKFNQRAKTALHDFAELDARNDLEGLFALIASLDLVITVDNATAHFAAALGKPVWILLPQGPIWTWQSGREDCDWYPSARLFRQRKLGNKGWQTLLQEVSSALDDFPPAATELLPPSVPQRSIPNPPSNFTADKDARSALLINDTSFWYHWGCSCTSLALHHELRKRWRVVRSLPLHRINNLAGLPETLEAYDDPAHFARFRDTYPDIVDLLEQSDVVYINGEGTLHGLSGQAQALLYLACVAKTHLGKHVEIINHSSYPDDGVVDPNSLASGLYKKVYQAMDHIAIRESVSLRQAEALGLEVTQSFDCLPLYAERYLTGAAGAEHGSQPYLLIAGSVAWSAQTLQAMADLIAEMRGAGRHVKVLLGANANLAGDDVAFAQALHNVTDTRVEFYCADSEADWLNVIANADCLVSGRFHHSIAAASLGTPFVVLESNTPKIAGIVEMFELDCQVTAGEDANANVLAERLLQKVRLVLADPEAFRLTEAQRLGLKQLAGQNFS